MVDKYGAPDETESVLAKIQAAFEEMGDVESVAVMDNDLGDANEAVKLGDTARVGILEPAEATTAPMVNRTDKANCTHHGLTYTRQTPHLRDGLSYYMLI